MESVGGKIEAFYYAFGEDDVIAILDLPDNVTATRLDVTIGAAGLVRTKTTVLLTVEETDQALQEGIDYRAPGR